MAKQRYGLRLTLPGAPNTPHVIPEWPGYYRADTPTLVGGEGELSLDAAKELAESSAEVELVEIPASEVKAAEEQAETDIVAGRKGLIAEAKATRRGRDRASQAAGERVEAEKTATKEA